MKHNKTITVPARQTVVLDKTTCDICNKEIKDKYGQVDEVTIEYKKGYSYGDCGEGNTTCVDLCGNCFSGHLLSWLKGLGVQPRVENWDY